MEIIGARPKGQRYVKLLEWGKLVTVTGLAQILVQALGLITGIVIIRILPTSEYALYTLANTMLGTMTILADGGIGAGVMAQGGQVWQDKVKLGSILVTGLNLRKKFAVVSLLVAVPILFYLLLHHGAGYLKATLIVACLVPAFWAALSDSLLEIGLKLKQDIKPLQKNQVWVGVLRAILILPVFLFPFTWLAIFLTGIPRIIGNIKLKRIVSRHVDWEQSPDPLAKKQILAGVKRILPGAIYFCISGQVTIWLISIFGNTKSIAQLGALSRLTVILTVITTVFNTIAIPRFARIPNSRKNLLKKFFIIVSAISGLLLIVLAAVWMFPSVFLLILGKSYSSIGPELVLSVIGSCLSLLTAIIYDLSTARGWLLNPVIYIPINILSIVVSIFVFNVATLQGVLMINVVASLAQVLMNGTYCLIRIFKIPSI